MAEKPTVKDIQSGKYDPTAQPGYVPLDDDGKAPEPVVEEPRTRDEPEPRDEPSPEPSRGASDTSQDLSNVVNQMLKEGASAEQVLTIWQEAGRSVSEINPNSSVGRMLSERMGEDWMEVRGVAQDVAGEAGRLAIKDIPAELATAKPDQPGGQVATINGMQYYIPGSTMYEMGYRTPEEYRGVGSPLEEPPNTLVRTSTGEQVLIPKATLEGMSEISPEAQFRRLTEMGIIEMGSQLVKGEKIGEWGYLSPEQLKEQEIVAELEEYPDLAMAIREGKIDVVREAKNLGLVTGEQLVIAQSQIADIGATNWANKQLEGYINPTTSNPRWQAIVEDKIDPSVLRMAGYDITNEKYDEIAQLYQKAIAEDKTLDQYRGYATRTIETPLGKVQVKEITYDYPRAIKEGVTEEILRLEGLSDDEIERAKRQADLESRVEPYYSKRTGRLDVESAIKEGAISDLEATLFRSGDVDLPASVVTTRDIFKEILSFGQVPTETFNKDELSSEFDKIYKEQMESYDESVRQARANFEQEMSPSYDEAQREAEATGAELVVSKSGYIDQSLDEFDREANKVRSELEGKITLVDPTSGVEIFNGTKDEYTKWTIENAPSLAVLAKEVGIGLVPVYGTIYFWDKMNPALKTFSIVFDILTFVPLVSGAMAGARVAAGTSTRGAAIASSLSKQARIVGALRGLGLATEAEVKAPFTALAHPIRTARTITKGVRDIGEYLFHPRQLPASSVTRTYSWGGIPVEQAGSPEKAMYIRNVLETKAGRGDFTPFLFEGREWKYNPSALMEMGGLVHASPDVKAVAEGLVVEARATMPTKETGLFVSHEPMIRFTQESAFGGKTIPTPYEVSMAVSEVGKYRPIDLVGIDLPQVRPLNLADAVNVPEKIAPKLLDYIRGKGLKLYGSFNEWLKVKKAIRPNDLDLIAGSARDARQALDDVMRLVEEEGFQVRRAKHAVEVLIDGDWKKIVDIDNPIHHASLIPKELQMPPTVVEGIRTEKLGEQYLRQGYAYRVASEMGEVGVGAVTKRVAHLKASANDVMRKLREIGAEQREPGFIVYSAKTGERAVPTDKLFAQIAEYEKKFAVGEKMPEMKGRYFTRPAEGAYPFDKISVLFEEPLSLWDIAKMKARAPIEAIRTIFTPPISVDGVPVARSVDLLAEAGRYEDAARQARGMGNVTLANRLMAEAKYLRASERLLERVAGELGTRAGAYALVGGLGRVAATRGMTEPAVRVSTPLRVKPEARYAEGLFATREPALGVRREGIVEALRKPTIEIPREGIAEIPREPILEVPREPVVEIPREPITRVPIMEIPREPIFRVPPPEIPRVPVPRIPPPEIPRVPIPDIPPPPVPKLAMGGEEYASQVSKIVPGTFVWLQGRPQGKGEQENVGMYKILPPPYRQEDLFTMREPPPGYVDEGWSGKGMAEESLQVIGGSPLNNIENVDLGWARVNLNIEGGKPEIEYVHDVEANVGTRSQTIGMGKGQIPIEAWDRAKAQGIDYEDFVASYRGELVGGTRATMEVAEPRITEEESLPEVVEVKPKQSALGKIGASPELVKEYMSNSVLEGTEEGEPSEIEEEGTVEEEIPTRQYVKDRIKDISVLEEESIPQSVLGAEELEMIDTGLIKTSSEPALEEELPENVEVVPSYIRRKKPKNMKPWWEGDYYASSEPRPSRTNGGVVSERTHYGHKLLPPQLGGSL